MQDADERERMAQWVKETESRRRPRLKEHQMSQADIDKKNKSPWFQERLAAGKQSESYTAEKLSVMHFTVHDISEEKVKMRNLELRSPFDLLTVSDFFAFLVDVKRRNYRVPIGIPIRKLNDYEAYDKYTTRNKLIVYHFPIRRGHQDLFFISIKDIRKLCYTVGPFYHVETHQLISLTTKGLINKLEPKGRYEQVI